LKEIASDPLDFRRLYGAATTLNN